MNNRKKWVKKTLMILTVLLAVAGLFFGYIQYKIYRIRHMLSDCTIEQSGFYYEVPFEFRKLIMVQVRLNESEKLYNFILDTGAPTIISDSTLMEMSREKTGIASLNVTNNQVAVKESIVTIQNLRLGELEFKDVGALVMDVSKMGMLNCLRFDGILGYNILKSCVFQINFRDMKIIMSDQPDKMDYIRDGTRLQYTVDIQETPLINVTLNDTLALDLTLDTGHNGSLTIEEPGLVSLYQQRFPDRIVKRITRPSITIHGQNEDIRAKSEDFLCLLTSIRIGDLHFGNSLVTVRKKNTKHGHGLIGAAFLKNFILTLNYKEKLVYLYPLNKEVFTHERKMFGMEVTAFGDHVIVGAVYSGSLAEKRGIEVGDQVIQADDVPFSGFSPATLCEFYMGGKNLLDIEKDSIRIILRKKGIDQAVTLFRYSLFQ